MTGVDAHPPAEYGPRAYLGDRIRKIAPWRPLLADIHLMLLDESGKLHTPEPKGRRQRAAARREHAGIWVAIRIVGHLLQRIDEVNRGGWS